MKTTKKASMLNAMKEILQEYKEKTHSIYVSHCPLCRLYNHWGGCPQCPMEQAFGSNADNYGCFMRRCQPFDCTGLYESKYKRKEKYAAVIEFYERIIPIIEAMTPAAVLKNGAFDFMKAIDNEIADKYNLRMPRKKKVL